MSRVIAIGDSCIDVYVGLQPRSAVGGNALNVAVSFAKLGSRSEFIGAVGDDPEGVRVRVALAAAGVRADRVHVVPGRTWIASIALPSTGVAKVIREDPGSTGNYAPEPAELSYAAEFDHVHMANLADPARITGALRSRAVSTSYDHGVLTDGQHAVAADVVFLSCGDRADLGRAEEIARAAVADGAALAVVTAGAKGSLSFDGHATMVVPAHRIQPVDTLGAGDSYIATFLTHRLQGSTVKAAMRAATSAAAATCLHWAAWRQPPDGIPVGGVRR